MDTVLLTVLNNFAKLLPVRCIMVYDYQTGMKWRWGKRRKVLRAGPHFCLPFISRMEVIETVTRVVETSAVPCMTEDGEPIIASVGIDYAIVDIDKYWQIDEFESSFGNFIESALSEAIATSEYDDIVKNRGVLISAIEDRIESDAKRWGVRADSARLVVFSQGYFHRVIGDDYAPFAEEDEE